MLSLGMSRLRLFHILVCAVSLSRAFALSGEPGGHTDRGISTVNNRGPLAGPPTVQAADSALTSPRWWSRIYGALFYNTRWDGWFIQSYLQQGCGIVPDNSLSLYGIAWLTSDTRSRGAGPAPVIISDNALILGVGIRYRPVHAFWVDVQEGLAMDLIDRVGSTTRGDFRAVATAGTGAYPEFLVHPGLQSPMSLLADFFISTGYYSRYKNGIGYAQGRLGVRAAEISRAFMDVYLRFDAAFDTEGEFYNNLFEAGPGFRFTPDPEWGLFLMVEYHHGIYADYTTPMKTERELFYPRSYNTVRFLLVFDRDF